MTSCFSSRIKGRYIVILWLLPVIYIPGLEDIYQLLHAETEWYWFDLIAIYYWYTMLFLLLFFLVKLSGLELRRMYGRIQPAEIIPAFKLTAYIFIFSIAAIYWLLYPLSFVAPEFVQWWYLDSPSFVYMDMERFPVLPNVLSFVSLVILAPLLEEFMFRGLLLHRWSKKWGILRAVLMSSILFGVLHPDPLGAVVFGIAMCILYLRTQTLWLPVICHALNNLAAWLIEMGYMLYQEDAYEYTLEDFQGDWYWGVICTLIVLFWSYRYISSPGRDRHWSLPAV